MGKLRRPLSVLALPMLVLIASSGRCCGEMTTWDGRHSIENIEVTVVYFVPADRKPLPDWKDRVEYFSRRIRKFHRREYQGQSNLRVVMPPEPYVSTRGVQQLRSGDANFIFSQTLREVNDGLPFAQQRDDGVFPILLVLSDINWRPLDDFYRLSPQDGGLKFEGSYTQGRHFPGAKSGGARAAYLADPGSGWALVSADGWRVPYAGTDCVVYHEGVGHTVGLPHPQPGNGSVMSLGQYRGWINESWLDNDQKERLGWKKNEDNPVDRSDLFSVFQALPEPLVPEPGEPVSLQLTWPQHAEVKSGRVRFQTQLLGPWIDVPLPSGTTPESVTLGRFDRPTPVSYRVDVKLADGETEELWGYFQVRETPSEPPQPRFTSADLRPNDLAVGDPAGQAASDDPTAQTAATGDVSSIDLLALVDPDRDRVAGKWSKEDGRLLSPKQYGARVEIPYAPPEEYELTVVVEPLDEPDGLTLGQISDGHRFLVLVNFTPGDIGISALENVDGRNFNGNPTTLNANLFEEGRPSQVICTVRKDSVRVRVDGREIIHWKGEPSRLSLSDYWATPTTNAMFLGAYDCRYQFSRVTLRPLSGKGRHLKMQNDDDGGNTGK